MSSPLSSGGSKCHSFYRLLYIRLEIQTGGHPEWAKAEYRIPLGWVGQYQEGSSERVKKNFGKIVEVKRECHNG